MKKNSRLSHTLNLPVKSFGSSLDAFTGKWRSEGEFQDFSVFPGVEQKGGQDPHIPAQGDNFSITWKFRGKTLEITISNLFFAPYWVFFLNSYFHMKDPIESLR